jgi:hypothetical protein
MCAHERWTIASGMEPLSVLFMAAICSLADCALWSGGQQHDALAAQVKNHAVAHHVDMHAILPSGNTHAVTSPKRCHLCRSLVLTTGVAGVALHVAAIMFDMKCVCCACVMFLRGEIGKEGSTWRKKKRNCVVAYFSKVPGTSGRPVAKVSSFSPLLL